MKIQAINSTQFKGLYTDKSAQNDGNWKMEYQPYSWEINDNYKFGTGRQMDVDITYHLLPDNEKIYIPAKSTGQYDWYPKTGKESCHDILGTEFYYHNFDTKTMRNQIDHLEAMNREDSLRVLNTKLDKFMEMKEEALTSLEETFKTQQENLATHSRDFDSYANDYEKGLLDRKQNKSYNKFYMVNNKQKIMVETDKVFENIKKYAAIRQSMNYIRESKAKIADEIATLQKARESGNLIDISQRVYTYDPNRPLWAALQHIESAKEKLVALPHKTISVKEILKAIEANAGSKDIADKAIKYIDNIMRWKM